MAYIKPEIDKVCAHCGENFTCQHRHKKFCSDKCLFEADRKRALAYYYSHREPREMETRQCSYCKEDFDTNHCHKRYCCPEHRTLAIRKRLATPESRAKHREANKKYRLNEKAKKKGWTVAERRKYGSKYWFEVIKPRLQLEKEAEALLEVPDKIPPVHIQNLPPEKIVRYWGRII